MKENYDIELNNLVKEYERKHKELAESRSLNKDRVCIRPSEYDKLTRWFLEEKLKLMKKYNISTQK